MIKTYRRPKLLFSVRQIQKLDNFLFLSSLYVSDKANDANDTRSRLAAWSVLRIIAQADHGYNFNE